MTKNDLLRLAELRILEADMLVKNGFPDSSFYLAGYSIELLLKARICSLLDLDDFFAFDKARKEFYRPFKTHDFYELVILSGLYNQVQTDRVSPAIHSSWSIVIQWDHQWRYRQGKLPEEVSDFINSVKTFRKWISDFI